MGHFSFCSGSGVQEKSVQRPLMSPYLIFQEWVDLSASFKLTPFQNFRSDFGVWIYRCKWYEVKKNSFESCMKIVWTLRFLENWHFRLKLRVRALFNDGGNLKFDPLKKFEHFIRNGLLPMLIWTLIWMPPLNCSQEKFIDPYAFDRSK